MFFQTLENSHKTFLLNGNNWASSYNFMKKTKNTSFHKKCETCPTLQNTLMSSFAVNAILKSKKKNP
jgi:hypothetical protein